jgi:integrase
MESTWIKDAQLSGLYKRKCASVDQWYVKARQRGAQPRTIKIGRCDVLSAKQARTEAKVILGQLANGINPNEVRREEAQQEELATKHAAARGITLQHALDQYLSLKDYKPKTQSDMRSMFDRNFSDWLKRPLKDISREAVLKRFGEIRKRVESRRAALTKKRKQAGLDTKTYSSSDGQGEAQKAFRYLQAVINSFMDDTIGGEPLLSSNPCKVLKDKRVRVVLKPRESYLDEADRMDLVDLLTRVKHSEYQGSLSQDDADFLLLLLMTGLRVDEARTLNWANVDLEKGTFRAVDTKNGRDHTLPMTDSTHRMFLVRHKKNNGVSEWVFPSPIDSSNSASMSRTIERAIEESGVKFTAHDLRRTVATVASDLGYDLDKVSAVLNHAKQGVTAGYVQRTIGSVKRTLEDIEAMVLRSFEVSEHDMTEGQEGKSTLGEAL